VLGGAVFWIRGRWTVFGGGLMFIDGETEVIAASAVRNDPGEEVDDRADRVGRPGDDVAYVFIGAALVLHF